MEEYKEIPILNGKYLISKEGEVINARTGKVRKVNIYNGYKRASLNHRAYHVHSLVAWTYIGDQGNNTVNHIDGNKLNNKLSNLEYVSRSQNLKHAHINGLIKSCSFNKINCYKEGVLFKTYNSYEEINEDGFRISNVSDVLHKRNYAKTHKGFVFEGIN